MIVKNTEGNNVLFGLEHDRKQLSYLVYQDGSIKASFAVKREAQGYIKHHKETDKRKHKYELVEVLQDE